MKIATAVLASALSSSTAFAAADGGTKLPAFPGADGAAAYVTGGRGGVVYHVTKLDESSADNAPGTLRFGLDDKNFPGKQPRTIVFDVGGKIFLGRAAQQGWDPNGNGWDTSSRLSVGSNVTIAGETAPSPVVIMGGTIKVGGDNVVIRNLTVAPGYGNKTFFEPGKGPPKKGDTPDSYSYDAFDISGTRVMIDHCTTVYATDETISMNERANHVTLQYNNVSQGQNYPQGDAEAKGIRYTGHALGSLLQAGTDARISVHHNLYAHQKGRLPRVGSEEGSGAYNDFRNNVFYNWLGTAGTGAKGQPSFNNFVNNFYLAGPGGENASDGASTDIRRSPGGTQIFDGYGESDTRVYAAGNVKDLNRDGDAKDLQQTTAGAGEQFDYRRVAVQKDAYAQTPYAGVTDTAAAAFERVLAHAGANWWRRGDVDRRLVDEVRTGRGKIVAWADDPFDANPKEGVEWRALVATKPTARPADFDADRDGMPDAWEAARQLDPKQPDHNGDADADGYTNLEEYLHETAAWPAPRAMIFRGGANRRYELAANWDSSWQPSRFDEVRIEEGVVTLDSLGQHAGTLNLAATDGARATLRLLGGELTVARDLKMGAGGALEIAGDEGQIKVAGRARLGGALRVTSSAKPARRLILAAGEVAGAFDSVEPGYAVETIGGEVYVVRAASEGVRDKLTPVVGR